MAGRGRRARRRGGIGRARGALAGQAAPGRGRRGLCHPDTLSPDHGGRRAGLATIWVSPRVAALVSKHAVAGDPPPVLAGYTEPSLVFLLGTETRLTDGTGAAEVGAFRAASP